MLSLTPSAICPCAGYQRTRSCTPAYGYRQGERRQRVTPTIIGRRCTAVGYGVWGGIETDDGGCGLDDGSPVIGTDLNPAVGDCVEHSLDTVVHVELAEHARHVVLDRLL